MAFGYGHPLRFARLTSLFLCFAFAVIAGSVGLNALIKSNQQKSFVRKNTPAGVTVDIDTKDVFDSGIVLTTASALLALVSLISLLLHIALSPVSAAHSSFWLRVQSAWILFSTLWIFTVLIPFDKFARQQSASITAKLGNTILPSSFVQMQEKQLGVSAKYWDLRYIRYVAIIPWITVLFGVIAGVVLWIAARRVFATRTPAGVPVSEKPAV